MWPVRCKSLEDAIKFLKYVNKDPAVEKSASALVSLYTLYLLQADKMYIPSVGVQAILYKFIGDTGKLSKDEISQLDAIKLDLDTILLQSLKFLHHG